MTLLQSISDRRNKILIVASGGVGLILAAAAGLNAITPALRVEMPDGDRAFEVSDRGAIGVGTGSTAFGTLGDCLKSGGGSGNLMSYGTCGSGGVNTGSLMSVLDNRYVNEAGDGMTGALAIRVGSVKPTADTGLALEVMGTASGRKIHATDLLTSSGGTVSEGGVYITSTPDTRPFLHVQGDGGKGNTGSSPYILLREASGVTLFDVDSAGIQVTTEHGITFWEALTNNQDTQMFMRMNGPTENEVMDWFAGQTYTIFDLYDETGDNRALTVDARNTVGNTMQLKAQKNQTTTDLLKVGSGALTGNTAYLVVNQDGNVGLRTDAPDTTLEIVGTASGTRLRATELLSSSGVLIVKKLAGTNTGNILVVDTKGLVYDATNKRVGIGITTPKGPLDVADMAQYGDVTPRMTSNTAPSPYVAAASTEVNPSNQAWQAFDRKFSLTSRWQASVATGWLRMDFSTTQRIRAYSMIGPESGEETFAPMDWTFEGSDDASSWTVLDTQTGITWTTNQVRNFTLSATASYRYYRLNCTANNGGARLLVNEFHFFEDNLALLLVGANQSTIQTGLLEIGGLMPFVSTTTSGTIRSTTRELILEQTGDQAGTSRLRLQNRGGANGAQFENPADDLVDFSFKSTGGQMNIRFEHRTGIPLTNNATDGEFQFIRASDGSRFFQAGQNQVHIVPQLSVRDSSILSTDDVTIKAGAAGNVPLAVKGTTSQTGNLQEWRNSSNTVQALLTKDGTVVLNEQGADADTRIEGDTDANLVFTDASTDRVGIGTAAPETKLEVSGTMSGAGLSVDGPAVIQKILSASATLDFGVTSATCNDLTITVAGAASGDPVFLGAPNGAVSSTTKWFFAWVSAANTVTVRLCDFAVAADDPASGTFRVEVHQF